MFTVMVRIGETLEEYNINNHLCGRMDTTADDDYKLDDDEEIEKWITKTQKKHKKKKKMMRID